MRLQICYFERHQLTEYSPAKPSRPARAYLKVKEQSLLDELSVVVKQTSFQDAKNTGKDTCLLGPPSLEFAPYNKIPTGRARNDGRQGTIDQDQEFIDFLQSLTEPITKPSINGTEPNDAKGEKVSTTPLVQYIKEKKANKAKEASQAKAAKARENKESKASKPETKSTIVIKGKNAPAAEKDRVAKTTQDTVKVVNKSAATTQGAKQTAPKVETKQEVKEKQPPAPPPPTPKKERERGNASAAARMLQRDLGLLPKESKAQRAAKLAASSTPAEAPSSTKATPAVSKPETNKKEKEREKEKEKEKAKTKAKDDLPLTPTTSNPPTGPRASRTPSAASTTAKSAAGPSQRNAKTPQPSAGAKSAFLKHANPSQGITEESLQTVFKQFGTITRCEIDKKKGLGYVDFTEPDGLKNAMQASPVKVGNGQVMVLENKNAQGGGKRAGGQQKEIPAKSAAAAATATASSASVPQAQPGQASSTQAKVKSPAAKSAAPAPATSTAATAPAESSAATTPATTPDAPPSAPRGSGRNAGRGGRGGGGGGGGGGRGNNRGSGQGSKGRNSGRGNTRRGGAGGGADASSKTEGGVTPASTSAPPTSGGGTATAGSTSADTKKE